MQRNQRNRTEEPVIFTRWLDFLAWLLPTTEKFPKRVRFTFANRINNLGLDIVEDLVEARYSPNKLPILQRINLRLENCGFSSVSATRRIIFPIKAMNTLPVS